MTITTLVLETKACMIFLSSYTLQPWQFMKPESDNYFIPIKGYVKKKKM